jgi:serine/threonine protein kinase/tetratricopeptide (TPR) repeat protein
MTPERWQQIEKLFHSALERESGERAAFLAQACNGDESLRREVESLIGSHEKSDSFIEAPAADIAAELVAGREPQLAAGHSVGPYQIVCLLGEGGMGEVYLAQDTRLGRQVALKRLPAQFTLDAERVCRFEQEARAASALNHPNIVTIHEIGHSNSLHFITTEFIDGETLREHLATAPMKLNEVLEVATQIASALATAHAVGIVHRDIKPENIMLRRDRIVKVLDFGLAKLAPQGTAVDTQAATSAMVKTNPGMVMGTVQYMSPEQAGGKHVDVRTDIWSLGVVLYEMVTGRVPFQGDTSSHVVVSIIESEPPSLSLYAEVPEELERIVSKALRKNKEERYQTASDLELDLKGLKQELEVDARMKRSLEPEKFGVPPSGDWLSDAKTSPPEGGTPNTVSINAHPTSSAEYLVSEIKRHKRGVTLVAAATLIAFAVVGYFYFLRNSAPGNSGEAIDSVAVLPFVNVNSDPNTEYLSDGMSDSIINSLSRLPNLKVNSLNSVLGYKGKQIDSQVVGRELKVRAVLISRMTQRGDALAITTELVDVRDNRRLWGGQYNRKLSEILVVQDEIAREITEGLRLRLTGEEKKQLAKQHTQNNDAYLHYSLGNYYFRQNTKEAFEKGIESFKQAIKIDPNYALAYTGLAGTYQFMRSRGFGPASDYEPQVEWAALKALQLDDTLAEAHVYLGVHKFNNFDWVGAEKEITRALELDPNSSQANDAYFSYLAGVGRADDGLPYAIRAQELDSMPRPGAPAFAYFLARQYDKAIELYRKGLEKKPDNAHAHILLGEAYVAKSMFAEGVAEMEKGVALDVTLNKTPERWDRYPMLAYAYAVAGRRGEALKILADQKQLAKERYVSPYNFAIIYTGLGNKDRAFEWLTRCVEQRTQPISFHLKSRSLFDPLRSDARYADLLRRMNLEP